MAVRELRSQREKRLAGLINNDVYQYDQVPNSTRVQLLLIGVDVFGEFRMRYSRGVSDNRTWDRLEKDYCREIGIHQIRPSSTLAGRIEDFYHNAAAPKLLDFLELVCCQMIGTFPTFGDEGKQGVEEINHRLRQGLVGYQFENNQIVRVDSQFIHAEVVKPALKLMNYPRFEGPLEEYLEAHNHYRNGEYKQAIAQASNAFESMMKAVCDEKGWAYDKNARVSDLVKVLKSNALWPEYMDNSFEQLIATLKSGLSVIRDKDAAHGQGGIPKEVPDYIAAYALHLAASKIVLIGEAARV
ncbi:HEPN domain-containing protein [Sphingomonas sp. PvP055]|uniref:STM4504/CBY_0614 family protein n=1 Tax=Sphingomonas sp. PvP055 TaxID=3156391 RepID=UPI00339A6FD4